MQPLCGIFCVNHRAAPGTSADCDDEDSDSEEEGEVRSSDLSRDSDAELAGEVPFPWGDT